MSTEEMMTAKAIETVFKGFRFRSRLEARWAVFLDKLGADFTYEKEGYDLDGDWYLPDFWVKDWDYWVEIKPDTASPEELIKCEKLSSGTKKKVILIAGEPQLNKYEITLFGWFLGHDPTEIEREPSGITGWNFGQGRRLEDEIWLVHDDYGATALNPIAHKGDHKYPLSGDYATKVVHALETAQQARFEHGETP